MITAEASWRTSGPRAAVVGVGLLRVIKGWGRVNRFGGALHPRRAGRSIERYDPRRITPEHRLGERMNDEGPHDCSRHLPMMTTTIDDDMQDRRAGNTCALLFVLVVGTMHLTAKTAVAIWRRMVAPRRAAGSLSRLGGGRFAGCGPETVQRREASMSMYVDLAAAHDGDHVSARVAMVVFEDGCDAEHGLRLDDGASLLGKHLHTGR